MLTAVKIKKMNKQVKQLLRMIHDDWNSLRDQMEINIIKKYTCDGRFFTILTMCKEVLVAICAMSVYRSLGHITLKRTATGSELFCERGKYCFLSLARNFMPVSWPSGYHQRRIMPKKGNNISSLAKRFIAGHCILDNFFFKNILCVTECKLRSTRFSQRFAISA